MDRLYTLFKYRFSGKSLQRVQMCLAMCKEQSPLTKEIEECTKCRVLQKKALEKKVKQHLMSALQKNKPTQTSGSVFAERTEKVKKRLNLIWNY